MLCSNITETITPLAVPFKVVIRVLVDVSSPLMQLNFGRRTACPGGEPDAEQQGQQEAQMCPTVLAGTTGSM